jgi:preprotein translocase subunit SecF
MTIPFVKYTKVWLTIGAITVVVCLGFLVAWKLKPGIDFTGGSLMEVTYNYNRPNQEDVQKVLQANNIHDSIVQKSGDKKMIIRMNFLNEPEHQALLAALRKAAPVAPSSTASSSITENQFQTIGAAVSAQLRSRALWAIIFVSIGIVAYMAYAFRKVSRPVASWKYGAVAIVAMIHDIILVLGIFSLLGRFADVEVDIAFVVALLTVLGYSVNDTIVVFDRIRENLLHRGTQNFPETVNAGLNETLMRSINTTLTVLLPLAALYIVGGPTVHYFALALFIGMASGAYSSIFIASPLLALAGKNPKRPV